MSKSLIDTLTEAAEALERFTADSVEIARQVEAAIADGLPVSDCQIGPMLRAFAEEVRTNE